MHDAPGQWLDTGDDGSKHSKTAVPTQLSGNMILGFYSRCNPGLEIKEKRVRRGYSRKSRQASERKANMPGHGVIVFASAGLGWKGKGRKGYVRVSQARA